MPRGLHLYYGAHEPHFITCSCYHRRPNLRSTPARNRFLSILEQTRKRYRFVVVGYVIMPEHIHLLLSEPEVGTISTVMQVLKQRTARALLPKVKPDPLCATHPSQKAREGRATRPPIFHHTFPVRPSQTDFTHRCNDSTRLHHQEVRSVSRDGSTTAENRLLQSLTN